jgi:L-asparagine oxygenase
MREDDYSVYLPVLSGSWLEPQMCVHFSSMTVTRRDAKWALDTLRKALAQVGIGFHINPGDLLIMDNRLVAHARSFFQPKYDGKDRWLPRIFIVVDFHQSSFSRGRGQHVCSPLYVEDTRKMVWDKPGVIQID